MKRFIFLLLVLTGTMFSGSEVFASHGMGGEITWTCLANGQFKFKMKFYRDCNGIAAPANVSLSTTVPGVPNINLIHTLVTDISPVGTPSPGTGSCPNCASPGSPVGVVEEHIYESNPINLNGTPPAGGWVFSWGECCRSNALTNISNPGSVGFSNRAVMFPYQGRNMNPCYDSSPFFMEKPSTIICTGYPFKYNPNAADPELDSLVSAWGQPLDDSGNNVAFAPGYSINSQLPSPTQNASNVAATINPVTGEMAYTSYTGGYFATVVKVTAYKCGTKVAEIYREINVVLNSNCPPVSGQQNLPPDVNAPFVNPNTGLYTSYIDTVYAGDTVNFVLSATDFQFYNNGGAQTITVEASGIEFGTNFSNVNSGCIIPPCATLVPAYPSATNPLYVQSFQIAGQTTFNWVTTCSHVEGLDTNCRRISNTYNFVIKATDNYCPANASNVATISIVILPAPKLDPPVLRCASVNPDGSVSLSWTKPAPRDSQNTYHSYQIYAALAAGGPWQLVDSILTGYTSPASYSYTHTLASLTTLFGTNAQNQSIFYYLKTRSGCRGDSISIASNILQTMKLNASVNGFNDAVLNWNALCTPPLSSHAGYKYMIWKEFPLGTWTLIDSTSLLTYTDTTTRQQCTATIRYKISRQDSSGCVSFSSTDEININNPNPAVVISPLNPSVCNGGTINLTCNTIGNTYQWSNGGNTQTITVSTTGTYTVTVTQNGGCTATGSTTVTINNPPAPVITGINVICDGTNTTFDAGPGYTVYQWSGGLPGTQTVNVSVAGTYTVTVTDANGCSATATRTLTVNPAPSPTITGNTTFCQGQNSTLNAGAGYTGYAWNGGASTSTLNVTTGGTYTVTVTNAGGCTGTTSTLVTVNPLPQPIITGTLAFCQGSNTVLNAGPGYSGYQWSGGLGSGQTATVSTANTFTVTVTDANGCVNSTSTTTTVNANPVPAITGINSICDGTATIFDAGGPYTGYQWSGGLGSSQTINIGTAGTYTVTVTDANGCTGTATRTLTVNPNPAPTITGNMTFCQGQNSTLNAGAGYTGYAWNGGASTSTLNVTASGTYTVTVTNNFGCTGSTSAVVTVNPLPQPVITGTLAFCQGSNTTLDAGPGYTNYQWSGGLGAGQTATVSTANTFTVTVTDVNGCVNSTSTTTTVNANPVPAITGINSICDGTATIFDAGGPYTGYQWSGGLGSSQTINIGTAGTYTVTVTDANGCTGTATRTLTVNPNPAPTITGNMTFCQGQNSTLNAGAGYTGYAWNGGASTSTLNVTASGTYTVTVTNNFGCTGTASAIVTVNALPQPVITGTLAFCQGSNTTLDAGAGYTNYQWSNGLGSGQTATVSTANTFTVTVTDVNGCVNNTSATTTVNANPIPVITGVFNTCDGQTTQIDAGAGYSNYQWSTGDATQTINIGTAGLVTVTVTDVNGCIGTTNTNITVYVLPTAAISVVDTICFGQATSINVAFTGPGPYTYSYNDALLGIQGPFTTPNANISIPVNPAATTNYTLITVSNSNCTGTVSGLATVEVTPLPSAVISGTTAICNGQNTDLTINFSGVAPYVYSYTVGGTVYGPFTTNNPSETINVSPTATTIYGLTATLTGFGCTGNTDVATATVTVHDLPSATVTGNNTICDGNSTDLTFNFVGTGPFTYSYNAGGTVVGPLTTSNNPEIVPVSPNATTTYNLVNISDANCAGSVSGSVDVIVNPLPTAAISGTTTICYGTSTDLSIAFTGTGPYTYWYNDGSGPIGPITTSNNPEIIPVNPLLNTSYTVTTVSDANCPGSGSGLADITVTPLPTSTLTGTTEICRGSSTDMTLVFTGVAPFEYTYTDDQGTVYGPFTTNNFNETINVSPGNTTSYNVTFLSGAGCEGTPSGVVDVTVNSIPAADAVLSGNGTICNGENSSFSIDFTGLAPYTYSYTDGSGTFGPFTTSNNPEVIPVNPSLTTTYSLINMSDDKCPGLVSGAVQITVNPLPVATVSGNPSICEGSSTSFTIDFTGTGPYTYTYSDSHGNSYGPFTTSNNPEVIPVSPMISTSYGVVTISDANCVGSPIGSADVTVNQIPSATITGDAVICFGQQTDLSFQFNGVAPFVYSYSDGTNTYGPLSSASGTATIPVSPGTSAVYTLIDLSDLHCPGTIQGAADVTVNQLPIPVITGTLAICDGESSTLTATPGFAGYDWSNGNSTPFIDVTTGGVYSVTVTDLNGCNGSTSVNFTVNQTPVIAFTNDTSLSCTVHKFNFINQSSYPAGSHFQWTFGDGGSSTQSNPSHIYLDPGTFDVSLTIITQAGCTATGSQPVEIFFHPFAEARFTSDPSITNVFNGKVQFTDQSDYAVSWFWDFNDGSFSEEQNPVHYFNEVGDYKVSLYVTNIAGCPDTTKREIMINPFYIPNAFTPNSDGINDGFFDAGYALDINSYRLAIYNRWGQAVFKADNYNNFWNGLDENNNPAPEGVYVYAIDVVTKGGKKHHFNGTVSLIR